MMSKPELLLVGALSPEVEAAMERDYVVHRLWQASDPQALLREVGPRVRALGTRGDLGADTALLGALPKLEIVACFGVGVDAIDLEFARARGIRVTNTPDVLTDDVADMGMALLLAAARRIPAGDLFVRGGAWRNGPMPLTTAVSGKRLGILGLGRVGRALARRAAGFNLTIAYCNPRPKTDVPFHWYADVVSLAAQVDFLVICAAAGAGTRGLVDGAALEALGPEGILVNIARGMIVDEPALLSALRERRIAAAGLDVFSNEPSINPAFATLDNVVLQPHNGSGTVETRRAIGRLMRENLAAHFAGARLPTPVL
jgi:lactate dehydrogenase-like 2-hydroxyacid dehydrogenase